MPSSAAWPVAIVAGLVACLGVLLIRVGVLVRRPGAAECALRLKPGVRWASGIATFGSERLGWHRVLSLDPRPARSWPRSGLVLMAQAPRIRNGRPSRVVELSLRSGTQTLTLAMGAAAARGFISWLEASPPGTAHGRPSKRE